VAEQQVLRQLDDKLATLYRTLPRNALLMVLSATGDLQVSPSPSSWDLMISISRCVPCSANGKLSPWVRHSSRPQPVSLAHVCLSAGASNKSTRWRQLPRKLVAACAS
jgi:hypothetical protein